MPMLGVIAASLLASITLSYDVTAVHVESHDDAGSVAISQDGTEMAVGDPANNRVTLYRRATPTDPWKFHCTVQPPGNQAFGTAVAFSPASDLPSWVEQYVYIGAPLDDGSQPWHGEGYGLIPQNQLIDQGDRVTTAQRQGDAEAVIHPTQVLTAQGVVYRIRTGAFCSFPPASWSGPLPPLGVTILRPQNPEAGARFGTSLATQTNQTPLEPNETLGSFFEQFVVVGAPGYGPSDEGAAFMFWDVNLYRDIATLELFSTFYPHVQFYGKPHEELGTTAAAGFGVTALGGLGVVETYYTFENLSLNPPLPFPALSTTSQARFTGSTYSYGRSLDFVEGEILAIGEPDLDVTGYHPDSGAVHIVRMMPQVGHLMTLTLPDYSGVPGGVFPYTDDRFGAQLDAADGRIAVGAPGKDSIFVFERSVPGDNTTFEHVPHTSIGCGGVTGIYPPDGTVTPDGCDGNMSAGTDGFGRLLAIAENTLVAIDPNLANAVTGQLATYFEFQTVG